MEKKFKRVEFILDTYTDKELIDWLNKQYNRSMYIRDLIQLDLEKHKNKKRGA